MLNNFKAAAEYIQEKINYEVPDFAIILGSGLSGFVNEVEEAVIIPYGQIPHFPNTTVHGHQGNLIYGKVNGKKVLVMQGRFHYYEGHSIQTTIFPVRVFKLLGIEILIASNASGGVNKAFQIGDVMLIDDHINMMPEHPLRGENIDELGPRFVDMHEPYDHKLIKIAEKIAEDQGLKLQKGTYVALQGPTFETPAEYGLIKAIGGDAVGMSTVPEIIVAKHMNMRCFALSVITDLGGPDMAVEVSHEEVLQAANKAMPTVIKLVKELIKNAE